MVTLYAVCVTKTYMVEELAFPGSPADLHNPRGDNEGLVEPNTRVHLECAAYALKG